MTKNNFLLFILLNLTGIYSCKKDTSPPVDFGYNYFPDKVGSYIVYDIDSIFYEDNNLNFAHIAKIDTFKFQLKEKIESIYNDNQNRPTIRLQRFVKYYNDTIPYSLMNWQFKNVCAENRTNSTAEKVEENVRYIKLAFPVKANQIWDGNAQNTNGEMDYSYDYFDQQGKVGTIDFESVLQINQQNYSTLFLKQFSAERYARNVGLIYKKVINIQSQPYTEWNNLPFGNDSLSAFIAIPILQRVTAGYQYTMTVNNYGIE